MNRAHLRAVTSRNPEIASLARDAQEAMNALTLIDLVQLTTVYAEPLILSYPREPKGVLLLRVQQDAAPEEIEVWDTAVHYVYTARGIEIPELQGPTEGVRYRFVFGMVG